MQPLEDYTRWVATLSDADLYDEVLARRSDNANGDDPYEGQRYTAALQQEAKRKATGRYMENVY